MGDEVSGAVRKAIREGLVQTASECVRKAVPRAPIQYGVLRRSIRFAPPEDTPTGVSVFWGSFDVEYALAQEVGTGKRPGKFFLASSADEEYPKIKERIRSRLG